MARGKQGHASCKNLTKNHLGSQLLWVPTSPKVGVGGTRLHKKEGATPYPGPCKHSLQCTLGCVLGRGI